MIRTFVCGDRLAQKTAPGSPSLHFHSSAEPGQTRWGQGAKPGKAILGGSQAFHCCPGCSVGPLLSSLNPALLPRGGLSDCCSPQRGPRPRCPQHCLSLPTPAPGRVTWSSCV